MSKSQYQAIGQGLIGFSLLSFACLAGQGSAAADKRDPAPIRYAADAPTGTTGNSRAAPVPAPNVQASGPQRRVEFRYPDRPGLSYSAEGVRDLGDAAPPIAFSSGDAAISEAEAQKYAASDIPRVDRPDAIGGQGVAMAARARMDTPTSPAMTETAVTTELPRFQPTAAPNFSETGQASWYGPNFHGKPTASGEIFDQMQFTGAHPTLPLPSLVEITNTENGETLVVRINDRGPFVDDRIVDVSLAAAERLGFKDRGIASVSLRYLGPAGQPEVRPARPQSPAVQAPEVVEASLQPIPPAAAVRTPPQAVPNSAPADAYYVQLGAFADIANAQRLYDRLNGQQPVNILPKRVNGTDLFRVVVGPLDGRRAADALRVDLMSRGMPQGMVVAAQR